MDANKEQSYQRYVTSSIAHTSADAFASLFSSSSPADIIIRCGEKCFESHATVLVSASKYFEKALNGSFEVSLISA